MEKNYSLKDLKFRFDSEVNKAKLTNDTIRRYQSWIRRYLEYYKQHSAEISVDSSSNFLQKYENFSTRRQGLYALQFFMLKVMRQRSFIAFNKIAPEIKKKIRSRLNFLLKRFLS